MTELYIFFGILNLMRWGLFKRIFLKNLIIHQFTVTFR